MFMCVRERGKLFVCVCVCVCVCEREDEREREAKSNYSLVFFGVVMN
jgi:hypothetical protein